VLAPVSAFADSSTTYVSLGADLSDSDKTTVLKLLGVSADQLTDSNLVTVTNTEEHKYLDSYLSSDVIGTRALSSCRLVGKEDGYGIKVETHNITYCTAGMYENALATAGLKNADVVVAGPFNISGTAALVGAVKAYEKMTGGVIQPELVDASNDELVTTSKVAEDVGDTDKTTQLIAAVKQIIIENNYTSDTDIEKAIRDVASQLKISLSDEDVKLILELMKKISSLDIDVNSLTSQAKNIYEQLQSGGLDLSKYGITQEQANGFLAILQNFFNQIVSWFQNIGK
jgi:uncharacterized protein YpuA (DUF1002 family)